MLAEETKEETEDPDGHLDDHGDEIENVKRHMVEHDTRLPVSDNRQRRPSYHTERCFLSCNVLLGRKKIRKICTAISRPE